MARVEGEEFSLIEEREENMLPTPGSQEPPVKRKGLFLKSNSTNCAPSPSHLSHDDPVLSTTRKAPNADIRWWADPQDQWSQWVEKLRPKYSDLWRKVGIFDAIRASTYKFRRDSSSLWASARFWCEETNTFIFPWGEATVTLEDVMILGGFPVAGEAVRVADDGPSELESEMFRRHREITRNGCGKVYHSLWMRSFFEKGDDRTETEHVAFLSLWLSRYVLPTAPGKILRGDVFPIASRLARGVRIAFAPAVLASLYRNLRAVKGLLLSRRVSAFAVCAPFHILQCWLWERFSSLSPKPRESMGLDEPRVLRWNGVGRKPDFGFVMSVLESPNEFRWRPYVMTSSCNDDDDEELGSLSGWCLRSCELVGLDCIEQYLPHRVALQFGLDQDVPFSAPRANSSWKVAWETYDIGLESYTFHVPSRLSVSGVTLRYSDWWMSPQESLETLERKRRMEAEHFPCTKKKKKKMSRGLEELYDTVINLDEICKEEESCLVEEREEEMVGFIGSDRSIKRKAWFLKPTSALAVHGKCPTVSAPHHTFTREIPPADFRWWAEPQKLWRQWVEKLKPFFKDRWKKAGIFDAITISTYKLRRDPASLSGVIRFWCEETNTFVFPWGEATVTLEDVMILGGLSVIGEPIREGQPVDERFKEIEVEITRQRKSFSKAYKGKLYHSIWMKHYMEKGEGDELEHAAFLSFWLSKVVFPSPRKNSMRPYVIPTAARLAFGSRIALAPAVLASIYRGLRAMKDHFISKDVASRIVAWAPFNILQLWLWERFPSLRPKPKRLLSSNAPRAARWHDVGKRPDISFVMRAFRSPNEIQWRPYMTSLDNWRIPSFYKVHRQQVVCSVVAEDEELASHARCLRACELVGVDCIEQYLPHRVALQFGFDQEIPTHVPRANSAWDVAWRTYDHLLVDSDMKFCTPIQFQPQVTLQYSIWWLSADRFSRKEIDVRTRTIPTRSNSDVFADIMIHSRKQLDEASSVSEENGMEMNTAGISNEGLEVDCEIEDAEQSNAATGEEQDFELELERLKKDIALIHEKVMGPNRI